MSNLIDLYKEIFLHVIPVRIIVPCSQVAKHLYTQNLRKLGNIRKRSKLGADKT